MLCVLCCKLLCRHGLDTPSRGSEVGAYHLREGFWAQWEGLPLS